MEQERLWPFPLMMNVIMLLLKNLLLILFPLLIVIILILILAGCIGIGLVIAQKISNHSHDNNDTTKLAFQQIVNNQTIDINSKKYKVLYNNEYDIEGLNDKGSISLNNENIVTFNGSIEYLFQMGKMIGAFVHEGKGIPQGEVLYFLNTDGKIQKEIRDYKNTATNLRYTMNSIDLWNTTITFKDKSLYFEMTAYTGVLEPLNACTIDKYLRLYWQDTITSCGLNSDTPITAIYKIAYDDDKISDIEFVEAVTTLSSYIGI